MKIKNQPAGGNHYWPGTNKKTSITIHETANTNKGADAQAHANLQSSGNVRQASWHVQVDDREAIRSFSDDVRCWHAGRAAQDSLSLEICVNSDGDYDKALANAAEVVKIWRKEYGLGRADVVDHHHWTKKNCPTRLRASGDWEEFVAATDPSANNKPPVVSKPKPKARKSAADVAREIANGAGGWGNDPQRSQRLRKAGYDAADVQRRVNQLLGASVGTSSGSRASVASLAEQVIDGKWGNEPQRSARLRNAGHNAAAVQREVNRRLGGGGSTRSVGSVAQQIINGTGGWGNEPQRSQRLRAAGYNPAAVQREVNRRLR